MQILHGGSLNAGSAFTLIKTSQANGLLIGEASLKAKSFLPIHFLLERKLMRLW